MTIDLDGTKIPVPVPDDGQTHHIATSVNPCQITVYIDGRRP